MNKKPYNILNDIAILIKKGINRRSNETVDINEEKFKKLTSKFMTLARIKKYNLNHKEIMIIASTWLEYFIEDRIGQDPRDILRSFYDDPSKQIKNLDIIMNLLNKNILYTSKKQVLIKKGHNNDKRAIVNFNILTILEYDVEFHHEFLRSVLGLEDERSKLLNIPYENNKEYLDDWFVYIDKVYEASMNSITFKGFGKTLDRSDAQDYLDAIQWEERIESRSQLTTKAFPLQELRNEYDLDKNEIKIVVYLLKEELEDRRCDSEELAKLISLDAHDLLNNREYVSDGSKLVGKGLIEVAEGSFFMSSMDNVRLAPDIIRRIIMKTPTTDSEKLNQILKGNDLFTLVEPTQTFDDLILPEDMKKTISNSLKQYHNDIDNILDSWGLFDGGIRISNRVDKKTEPGMLMLFYGAPGTGKTFAAGAIAQALGKKLLITDISRIQSKWVGDSEKNVRNIFAVYERIVYRMDNPPILLLNEADQFLAQRLNGTGSSVDKMHNSMQNLFLEAFENLKGFLIATTNLRSNLDDAFSRRFNLKLEFPKPEAKEREELWRLHLPSTIPGADDIDAKNIAERYNLTGGQIKIIIRNAAIEAASRDGEEQKLKIDDLIKYCEIESGSSFERKRTVGF